VEEWLKAVLSSCCNIFCLPVEETFRYGKIFANIWEQKDRPMECEQNDDPGTCIPVTASNAVSQARRLLLAFLTEYTATLLGSFRSYVQRMGLAQGQAIPSVALDVLQEVAVEALAHVDRFDPERQPMAWLLGIGVNVIRRKKVEAAKNSRREITFGHLALLLPETQSEEELFDLIAPFMRAEPEREVEANEQASLILALVSPADQHILRLAILLDCERETLARELGITPVAARVRLHRALNRLRAAWQESQIQQQQVEHAKAGERKPL
jgi:RNA polymerase sigma-70 factor (ECF subfamily)